MRLTYTWTIPSSNYYMSSPCSTPRPGTPPVRCMMWYHLVVMSQILQILVVKREYLKVMIIGIVNTRCSSDIIERIPNWTTKLWTRDLIYSTLCRMINPDILVNTSYYIKSAMIEKCIRCQHESTKTFYNIDIFRCRTLNDVCHDDSTD